MFLRTLVRLVVEVAVWTLLVLAVSLALLVAASLVIRGIARVPRRLLAAVTIGGALVAAGLSDRLGLPGLLVVDVGRRPVPVVWVAAGSVVGLATAWVIHARRSP